MNLFDLDEEDECLFCDGECTCKKPAKPWQYILEMGRPVIVAELAGKKDVWCVTISSDRFNETIVCFDKNSGRHEDVSWDNLKPLIGYLI